MKTLLLLASTLLALASTREALAFCSAMSCDPSNPKEHCQVDPKTECVLSGEPLLWASTCVTFSVQKDAAPRSGVDYAAAKASLQRAIDAWTQADCGGNKAPSLHVELTPPVSCDGSEYNKDHRNANILIFREDEWPYEGGEDALGMTRVRFDPDNNVGELWDSDIELNAVSEPLSLGEPAGNEVDLDSLMTHEVGHALGLGHSVNIQATMIAGYIKGSTGLRSLGDDDVDGICSSYPPGRKAASSSCDPRHGFSEVCGADQPAAEPDSTSSDKSSACGVAAPSSSGGWAGVVLASLLGASRWGRRKSARN